MRRVVVLTGAVVGVAVAAVFFATTFSVSARAPHWTSVAEALDWLRMRAIRAEAVGITVPDNLDTPERLRGGVVHLEAHCRICHGAPGAAPGDLGHGMYPQPTDLAKAARRHSPAELFWILQNGIKMTGMPSWADHGDDELWSVVALLGRLPTMTPAEYAALAKAVAADMRKDDAQNSPETPTSPDAQAAPSHAGHHHHHHPGQHAH